MMPSSGKAAGSSDIITEMMKAVGEDGTEQRLLTMVTTAVSNEQTASDPCREHIPTSFETEWAYNDTGGVRSATDQEAQDWFGHNQRATS